MPNRKKKLHIFSRSGCSYSYYSSTSQTRPYADWLCECLRKGYDVRELIDTIRNIIDSEESMNVAVIGIGNLGRAVAGYFKGKRSKLNLVASFDNDPQKINKVISGVKCYPYNEIERLVKDL